MKPRIYPANETAFTSNGLGVLGDSISCNVVEERNDSYELKLVYPIDGQHYSEIKQRALIMAQPRPDADPQPFRIYRITRPLSGKVTVYAEHISYDLTRIPVAPFKVPGIKGALGELKKNAVTNCPFTFWTDIEDSSGEFENAVPSSIRSNLGGRDYSILDMYGGEFEWDRFTVKLWNRRGADRGFTIRYGKNLVDLTQEENCANVYTGVYPYWADNDDNLVTLSEKIVKADGTFDYENIMPLDCSSEFSEAPSESALREYTQNYIKKNKIGVPEVGFEVEFAKLSDSLEYADLKQLEKIELCDTVSVIFLQLGVAAQATVTKTDYDVLKERYNSITVGQVSRGIHRTIAMQESEIAGNSSDTGKNTTGLKQLKTYTNEQVQVINSKLELINADIITRTSQVDINNRTLYINRLGKMGTKGTVGGHYALYRGSSQTVDLVHSVTTVAGITTYDLWRLWFCNGLFIGYTDPNWIFGDGGDIEEWNGN